jgi:hypothetical protein
MAKHND